MPTMKPQLCSHCGVAMGYFYDGGIGWCASCLNDNVDLLQGFEWYGGDSNHFTITFDAERTNGCWTMHPETINNLLSIPPKRL